MVISAKEQVPEGIQEPLGNYVMISHYYDANLYHNVVTGWSGCYRHSTLHE
jgi:hypothetical protein